jgi:hypothetical protein
VQGSGKVPGEQSGGGGDLAGIRPVAQSPCQLAEAPRGGRVAG